MVGEEEECVKESAHSWAEGELREEDGHRNQGKRDADASGFEVLGGNGLGWGEGGEMSGCVWVGR